MPQETRAIRSTRPTPRSWRRAEQEAIAQKPLLRAYLNAEVRDQLVAGDVLAAQLWTTTAQQAMDAAPKLAFVYPTEGFPFYCDCAVILRESSRAELAHQFIDYLLRPDVAAQDRGSHPHRHRQRPPLRRCCRKTVRNNPSALSAAPKSSHAANGRARLTPATQRLRDRIWTEIKSA